MKVYFMIYFLKMFSSLFLWILIVISLGLAFLKNVRKDGFKEKCGWYLSLAAVLMLFLFSTKTVSNLLVYSLERNYRLPSKKIISSLDCMVILSGGVRPPVAFSGSAEPAGATYSRLINGIRIFKENNVRLLVLQGTSGKESKSDAAIMTELAEQLGVSKDKIIIESKSRNTLEHAIELRKIFPASKKMRLGVVTSAMHMRRSEMVFEWKFPEDVIVPIPVDYRYSVLRYDIENFVPSPEAFEASNDAFHELVGVMWYILKHGKVFRGDT